MKLKRKIDEVFADRSREFWMGFGAVLGADLLLAALVLYITLVVTPKTKAPIEYGGDINLEIPLALLLLVANVLGLVLLPRDRAISRGGLAAIWVALALTLCSGCFFCAWLAGQPM